MTIRYKYSVVVWKDQQIVHMVGYPDKPTESDFDSLREELKTEFGIDGKIEITEGPQEMTDWLNEISL